MGEAAEIAATIIGLEQPQHIAGTSLALSVR